MQSKRPTGITILFVLNIIGGIVMLILGVVLLLVAPIIPNLSFLDEGAARQLEEQLTPSGIPVEILGPILGLYAAILIALGIASFVVAIGLLSGRGWAWTLALILSIIGIGISIVEVAFENSNSIIDLVINGIVIYYLYRPNIKAYFGKMPAPAA